MTRKTLLIFSVLLMLAGSLSAQVEILPPDFVLFGKTSADYAAEDLQYALPLSTNGNYILPDQEPLGTNPVFFALHPLYDPSPSHLRTYFVPDNVYVYLPIVVYWADNVDACPPCYTVGELKDGLRTFVDTISGVHALIDGAAFTNLGAYRAQSPVFSIFFASSDNYYSVLLAHPLDGLDDPIVAEGYFLMLKPLPAGLHDFRTGATAGGPAPISFEGHFQVQSLPLPEFLAHETELPARLVTNSWLSSQRQQPLSVSLNAAKASFARGNLCAGINQLNAFQSKVRAQVAPDDEALAGQFTGAAEKIIDRARAQLPAN